MARANVRANVPLSQLGQKVLEENPDIHVTNETYVVVEIYDYCVVNNPMVRLKWAHSLQHLGFVKFIATRTKENFIRRKNGKKFCSTDDVHQRESFL